MKKHFSMQATAPLGLRFDGFGPSRTRDRTALSTNDSTKPPLLFPKSQGAWKCFTPLMRNVW